MSDRVDAWLSQAQCAFERGDVDRAVTLVSQAAEVEPENPQVLSDLGALMASTGLVEEAEAMLRQALSLDRGLADAWVNLARVLVQDGREVEACGIVREARAAGVCGDADLETLATQIADVGTDAPALESSTTTSIAIPSQDRGRAKTVLFADWRRPSGETHSNARRAVMALGWHVLDPTLAEIEETTRDVRVPQTTSYLDVERVVSTSRAWEGGQNEDDVATRAQLREKYDRLLDLARRACAYYRPDAVVATGGAWLETSAVREAAREAELPLLTLEASFVTGFARVEPEAVFHGRTEDFRSVSSVEVARIKEELGLSKSTSSRAAQELLDALNVAPGANIAVLIIEPESRFGRTEGGSDFDSMREVVRATVETLVERDGWHLVIWAPEEKLGSEAPNALEELSDAGFVRGNVSAVEGRAHEIDALVAASSVVVTTTPERALAWAALHRPIVCVTRTDASYVRTATRPALLRAALEELVQDPTVDDNEGRSQDLALIEWAERLARTTPQGLARAIVAALGEPANAVDSAQSPVDAIEVPIVKTVGSGGSGTTPEVSVIVPSYGRPDLLRALFENLKGQTLDPARFEVVVTDDGTEPPLEGSLSNVHVPYSLKILKQENRGPAAARNRAIRDARGRYLLILNDDAVPAPDLLERHLAAQTSSPEPRAWLGRFDYDDATRTPLSDALSDARLLFPVEHMDPEGPNSGIYFWTCNISVPRDVVLAVGGFDESFAIWSEDVELGHRLEREAGVKVWFLREGHCGHHHRIDVDWFVRRQLGIGLHMIRLYRKHGDEALHPGWKQGRNDAEWVEALDKEIRCRGGFQQDLVEGIRRLDRQAEALPEGPSRSQAIQTLRESAIRLSTDCITIGLWAGLEEIELEDAVRRYRNIAPLTTIVLPLDLEDARTRDWALRIRRSAASPVEVIGLVPPNSEGRPNPLSGVPDCRILSIGPQETIAELRFRVIDAARGSFFAFVTPGYEISERWLEPLVRPMLENPRIGATGPRRAGEDDSCSSHTERLHPDVVVTSRDAVESTLAPDGDLDFLDRLRKKGYGLHFVPDVVARRVISNEALRV